MSGNDSGEVSPAPGTGRYNNNGTTQKEACIIIQSTWFMSCANTSSYGAAVAYINLSAGNNRWWPEKWFSPTSTTTAFLFGSAAAVNRNFFKTTGYSAPASGVLEWGRGSGTGETFRTITTETRVKSSRFKSHKGDREKWVGRKRFAMTGSRKRPGFRETDGTRVSRAFKGGFFFYRKRFFLHFLYRPVTVIQQFYRGQRSNKTILTSTADNAPR